MNNYTVLHCHTDLSSATTNIDSVTKYEDYIKYASELGMKAIAITEHGNILSWVKKKETCEKYNIKYIHGIEAYLTETIEEKIRDNYHCCLYAKNWEGVKELNKLISSSFNRKDNHFYYTPRILIDDLFNTSDNIIIASACLGGVFNKGNDNIKKRFLNFFIKNKQRCFLEIQHHNVKDQIEYNKYLYNLSKEYNLQLVANTDTHCLNKTHEKGRSILQKAKNIHFGDEEGWDLTFKSYNELIDSYKNQNALPMEDVLVAIENTNKIAEMIEPFELNRDYKYPKLYDNGEEVLKQKVNEGILKFKINECENYTSEYLPRIYEELETYKHNKAIDFLLLDEDIKSWARKNNMHCGYSRGSCSGSIICYLMGITEVDSVKYDLNFERFMNKERVSLADIDTDWSPVDRDKVKEYIYSKEGLYCADIITFNTVALKGSIRDVCRALYAKEVPDWLQIKYNEECDHYGKPTDKTRKLYDRFSFGEYLEIANEVCSRVDIEEEKVREEYSELFEYVDIINGTVVSVGTHPCGVCCSPIPLDENMGLLSLSTCESPVTMLNMKEIDSLNYVKLDVLGLDNIQLINETCELAKIERLTPQNVDDTDEDVWMSIREDTTGIFQWEGTGEHYIKDLFSDDTIKKIKEKNPNFKFIDLMSVGNGAIRPAGASYRNELARGVFRDNGHEALNELLSPTQGFLVYQEQIIAFLNQFCNYTMGEADIVRRGFAKKTGTEQHIPRIKEGFIKTMKEKYGVDKKKSETIVKDFLQVIEDASSYLFSLNHSLPYSYIGYICGYLRYYYPLEFFTVFLNINKDNIEKTSKALEYMKLRGIKLENSRFRYAKSSYFMDKTTNTIYKGIGSIKYMNEMIAEQLYELKDNQYDDFTSLLIDIKEKTKCNSRQLDILIRLNFFQEFGKRKKLLEIVEIFNSIYGKKQFKKDKLPCKEDIIRQFTSTETDKIFKGVDSVGLMKHLEQMIPNEDITIKEIVNAEIDYTGTCSLMTDELPDFALIVTDVDTKYSPKIKFLNPRTGNSEVIKISKKTFKHQPLEVGDVVISLGISEKHKKTRDKETGRWIELPDTEYWLDDYKIETNN